MSVEDNPEFQKALTEAGDRQWGNWLYGGTFKKSSRRDVEKDLAKIQETKSAFIAKAKKKKRELEEIKRMHHPSLKRITNSLKLKHNIVGLICPKCGDSDKRNTMNGKPWCFKCRVVLVSPDKIGKWVDIKRGNMDSVRRSLRGLP